MTLDLEYYLNNQLKNSVVSLLEPIYPKSEVLYLFETPLEHIYIIHTLLLYDFRSDVSYLN